MQVGRANRACKPSVHAELEGVLMSEIMDAVAEQATKVESIEATLNYYLDTGDKPFTYTGGPGSLDVRTGGGQDPRRVLLRNGRPGAGEFALDRNGFRFVRHATQVADFFDEAQ